MTLRILAALAILGILGVGAFVALAPRDSLPTVLQGSDTFEVTDYSRPKDDDSFLVDDRIEDKKTVFNPSLIDPRSMGGWSLNASDAVIKLDVVMVRPDVDVEALVLRPSYADAIKAAKWPKLLPSVNMIDGKAKQFDDGLYAAIERAAYLGLGDSLKGHLRTIRRIHDKVRKPSPAADYLAAGLSMSSEPVEASRQAKAMAAAFLADQVASKPIGFYSWDKTLSECFRVLRFFSATIADHAIAVEIARILRDDRSLLDDYVKAYSFYARMTNPLVGRTPADLVAGPPLADSDLVTLFPPSTSRETELFNKLFPRGLPGNANLMREFITAIRSGRVDLKPLEKSGWYDYQVHALETLLLPDRGSEANKLLLTRSYKKRMLEAFQALMTKRRETHSRDLEKSEAPAAPPGELISVGPRLRVEPNPTYYLRTARSYAFLANFLGSTLGESTLKSLKGLREGGERPMDLDAELRQMRDLFYGLALLSAEDIGAEVPLLVDEPVDRSAAEAIARGWLTTIAADADLAVDTRVSVPVYSDPSRGIVRLWVTCGVRLATLEAQYARPPSLKPLEGPGEWTPVEGYKLVTERYLIAVDEFAEVQTRGGRVFNRAELRAICDRCKTKEQIVEALEK